MCLRTTTEWLTKCYVLKSHNKCFLDLKRDWVYKNIFGHKNKKVPLHTGRMSLRISYLWILSEHVHVWASDSAMWLEVVRNRQDWMSCPEVNPTVSHRLLRRHPHYAWATANSDTDAVRWLVAIMFHLWHWDVASLRNDRTENRISLKTEDHSTL